MSEHDSLTQLLKAHTKPSGFRDVKKCVVSVAQLILHSPQDAKSSATGHPNCRKNKEHSSIARPGRVIEY